MATKFPFFAQETDFTCGAACIRMMLAARGIFLSENVIAKHAQAKKSVGIDAMMLASTLRHFGIPVKLTRTLTMSDLQKILRTGIPVVLNYRMPGENVGHYGVAYAQDHDGVHIADPTLGPKLKISWKELPRYWYGHKSPLKTAGRACIPRAWHNTYKTTKLLP